MKVEYKGIIFDEFSLGVKNSLNVIDISKINNINDINMNNIECAWGYICQECAKKYNLNGYNVDDSIEGMMCYVDGCKNIKNVIEINLNEDELKELKFITKN